MLGALRRANTRWRVEVQDAISYGAIGRSGRLVLSLVRLQLAFSQPKRLARRIGLVRLLGPGWLRSRLIGRAWCAIEQHPARVVQAHARYGQRGLDGAPVTRTALLKAPGASGERGLLYTLFEYNWARIAAGSGDLRALLRQYDVVWVASWSPTDYLPLARILADSDADTPIYLQASNMEEIPLLEAFHPRIRVIPFLPCEAIAPESYQPRPPQERDIDLLVVSNWAPFKRHFELFRALRSMPRDLRIVCVGQPELGHTQDEIRRLAASYGVRQDIDFRESIPPGDVRALQVRSKAAAVFSRREGHCMSAVEALFAGASLGLMFGGHVGPVVYVNDATGVRLRPGHVGEDLLRLINDAHRRAPREWALAHLGAQRATEKLNDWLRTRAAERSIPWTTDVARMSWSPYPRADQAAAREALSPAARALSRRFPRVFGADLLDASRY